MRRKKSTKKKVKNPRVPRTRAGCTFTENRFWQFLRSGLRQLSRRWPPIHQIKLKNRRPSQSENKKLKWEYQCDVCKEWFPDKQVQVEHTIPCGTLNSWETFAEFAERLFVEADGLTLQCLECHKEKTDKERNQKKKEQEHG